MKPKRFSYVRAIVKTACLLFIMMATIGGTLAFRTAEVYNDIWQQLGISKVKGTENIKESFLNGYFNYYGAEKAKNILAGNRAAVAMDLMVYAKQQVSSPAFQKDYEAMRNGAKPIAPEGSPRTKEEIRKEKIEELEKSIKESKDIVKQMPDMAKVMQPTIDMLQKTLKEYKEQPNHQHIQAFYQGEVYEFEQRKRDFEADTESWKSDYPADHKEVIKKRLQEFVSLAKTVDFNAELKTVNGKKVFVNREYEGKPSDWKQIFRAGREVIEPAIAFAEKWIQELK
ncbi:MAG TPA: hypothetical protein VEB42_13580 [Chitinophagaceae bacterium]|nr:hypothetical protein [Chitinophagaceae bacterium]